MQKPSSPIVLHRFALSGHSHRVELFLSLLDLPTRLIDVDLLGGEQRKPPFLAKNGFGQVPVIEDGPLTLADSNAILVYLAERYDDSKLWLPNDAVKRAHVERWLSVSAGPLVQGPANARFARLFEKGDDPKARERATKLFEVMERELENRLFFAGDHPTVADLALYAYTAHAPEGGVSLDEHPRLRGWIGRIEGLPRFVPMKGKA